MLRGRDTALGAGSFHTNHHDANWDRAATAVPMASLVSVLAAQMERVVVDHTGLTGRYDLKLTWSRDDGAAAATDLGGPTLLTAVQEQLGLRLRAAKLPVETLVVERVVMPTGN